MAPRGLSTLEAVLAVLLVAAFLAVVLPLLLRGRARETGPGGEGVALDAESAAEEALVRAPRFPGSTGLDGTPVVAVDVAVEPGPRDGLERVRVVALAPSGSSGLPGTGRRIRLDLVRFVP